MASRMATSIVRSPKKLTSQTDIAITQAVMGFREVRVSAVFIDHIQKPVSKNPLMFMTKCHQPFGREKLRMLQIVTMMARPMMAFRIIEISHSLMRASGPSVLL